MHFHHTNPNWQMPRQCEAYLEKIQERGKRFSLIVRSSFDILAVENMHGSSILQQSMNDMQTLNNQRSYYSDPQCNREEFFSKLESYFQFLLATTSLHNRSVIARPLINTSVLSPIHTTVSVRPNTSIAQHSFLNGGVSKADLPYRSLAPLGVLSR